MVSFDLISVIVPCYNEEPTIKELYVRVDKALAVIDQPYEFILVDDGSTDGTAGLCDRLWADEGNFSFIRHFRRHGKSMALMSGFDVARGDVIVTMDGDLQDLPEMIPRLLEALETNLDLVNGWRHKRRDPFLKKVFSKFFNSLVSRLFGCRIKDINSGLKAYRAEVIETLELRGDLHRLIPVLVQNMGFNITEVPVEHASRKHGPSSYPLIRHRGLLDIISLMAISSTRMRPFHVFTEVAFFFFLLFLLSGGGWLWLKDQGGDGVYGAIIGIFSLWSLAVSTLLPLFGFMLELTTTQLQGEAWRKRLIRKHLPARDGADTSQ